MDGYEFTRRFRAWEAETGDRTPVIAMTAHAMTEDIGTSLEAGMDYHLIKPVSLAHLTMVLDHWLAAPPESGPRLAPPGDAAPDADRQAPESAPVDTAKLEDILGETDCDEVREVLQFYVTHADKQLRRIGEAVAAQDRDALAAAAHAAKGAARNAAAVALIPVLSDLEAGAFDAGWEALTATTVAAEAALARVRSFVEKLGSP
ncbi:MAG: response regulator [Rhodospirillaceae bacterium]